MSENNLRKKTVSGLIWSASEVIASQAIKLIIQIVLARLLLPKDFGMIGMITIFIALSQSIIDSGFQNALIREKKNSQTDYSTVFIFNLIMSIVIYIALFLSAPAISNFYGETALIKILRVLGVVVIINSFGLVQRTQMTKRIDFKTQTKISLISSIVSGIIAIFTALLGFGVWSLVIQTVLAQLLQTIILIYFNKWRPSLVFSFESFSRLFSFGWKLLVSGLINTLYDNIFYVIIGKIFSVNQLGYYTNAQKLRDVASQSITTAVQKVSYPVLSSIKEESTKLKQVYKSIIKYSVMLTFPIMLGLAATAPRLIIIIFGKNWFHSIPILQILCIAGMLFPLHAINLNMLQVKGRSDLFLMLEIIKKMFGVLMIVVFLFFDFSITSLVWSTVVTSVVSYFINSYYSGKFLDYSTMEQLIDIFPIALSAIIMSLIILVIGSLIGFSILGLIIQIIIGIISYILLCWIFRVSEMRMIINKIKEKLT